MANKSIIDVDTLSSLADSDSLFVNSGGALKQVSGIADYIVEEGTSGIWSYRKWNSGIAECWGKQTISNATWNAWGNAYVSLVISGVEYPFTFIETPDEIMTVSTPAGSCYPLIYADNTTTTSGRAQTVRPGTGSTTAITYHYRICGRWK